MNNLILSLSSLFTAILASTCCILPLIAFLVLPNFMANSSSYLEPFRPSLIGISVLALGLAWFQKLKPKSKVDCDCTTPSSPIISFLKSKNFLIVVTFLTVLSLGIPYLTKYSYANEENTTEITFLTNSIKLTYDVQGMTCTGCEKSIENKLKSLEGVKYAKASHQIGELSIIVEENKTISFTTLKETLQSIGYVIKEK